MFQSRDSWLRSLLASVPADDPYQHITKVMELSRVHLFDIITQYRAVFSDDDPLSMGPLQSVSGLGQTAPAREEIPSNLAAVFQSWISRKVQEFIQTLETDLQRGVGGRLDSVLAQCMYFGLSFGRVGADFRSLVCPTFERAVLDAFTHHLQPAHARLLQEISSDDFLEKVQLGSHSGAPSSLLSHHALGSADTSQIGVGPPVALMDWHGLAVYCNEILMGFNDIRLCLPLTLAARISGAIRSSLATVSESLATLAESQTKAWNEKKKEKFKNAARLLVDVLAPFINHCLEALFPTKTVANVLGVGVTDFNKVNEMCRIDIDSLRQHLDPFLPAPQISEIFSAPVEKEEETVNEADTAMEENHHGAPAGTDPVIMFRIAEDTSVG